LASTSGSIDTGHRGDAGGSLSALALTVTDNTTRIHSLMRSAITSINPFSSGDSGKDVSFDADSEVPWVP